MSGTQPQPITIRGGRVLRPDGAMESVDLACSGRLITAEVPDTGEVIDARGALVLPGIIDVHGDAFERAVMPRPGVLMSVPAAIAETRPQLLAAGITTAFISVTDGWEPGLRSRETLRELVAHLTAPDSAARPPRLLIHVRHERCNTDRLEELTAWLRDGAVAMLSFNDHTRGGIALITGISDLQVNRSGLSREELEREEEAAIGRRDLGHEQERALAEVAAAVGVATASHDSHDDTDLQRDLGLGVAIAEFPTSIELARRFREQGVAILLGAPNLVRGRSHLGNLSVREAWKAGAADLLCSDYHYPSLLQAPFALIDEGAELSEAWHTVSRGPALAAGLTDRGVLEPGAAADLIVVEPPEDDRPARVRAVVVDGELATLAP